MHEGPRVTRGGRLHGTSSLHACSSIAQPLWACTDGRFMYMGTFWGRLGASFLLRPLPKLHVFIWRKTAQLPSRCRTPDSARVGDRQFSTHAHTNHTPCTPCNALRMHCHCCQSTPYAMCAWPNVCGHMCGPPSSVVLHSRMRASHVRMPMQSPRCC